MKFEEAIEYFGSKIPVDSKEYYKISNEYKTRAFTVSGYSSTEMINKFMNELEKALDEGLTPKDFKNNMNDFLEKRGYEGLTPYQADNIFRTNIQTAYNVGHYKQMTKPEVLKSRPYWMYDAVNDKRTRPNHAAMDRKVFPADHEFWDIWYPPNGFKCRCGVSSLSERQVKAKGLKIEKKIPKMVEPKGQVARPLLPDRGFDANPAKKAWEPDTSKYPKVLKDAFEKMQKSI